MAHLVRWFTLLKMVDLSIAMSVYQREILDLLIPGPPKINNIHNRDSPVMVEFPLGKITEITDQTGTT